MDDAGGALEIEKWVRPRQTCILVLGMHRSGTSALTRTLNLLGCTLPSELIGAEHGNDAGHWESRPIVLFNDELLASAGTRWDDWQPVNPNWYKSGVYLLYKEKARALIKEIFREIPLFVVKDPRILQIVPFWLDVFSSENIDVKIIIPVRDPEEVAASLEIRDMMELNYGRLLWLRRVLDAEQHSRDQSRIFCTYNQLLSDWRLIADRAECHLDIAFPRRSALVEREIDASLRGDLRHQRAGDRVRSQDEGLLASIDQVHALLSHWSEQGEEGRVAYSRLDAIRAEFDKMSQHFAPLILPGSRSGEAGEGSRRLSALHAQVEKLTNDLAVASNDLDEARRQMQAEQESFQERLALAENMLCQRVEDIDQTRAELDIQRTAANEAALLKERLAANDAWIFKLAGDRQAAEKRTEHVERLLEQEQCLTVARERENSQLRAELRARLDARHAEVAQLTRMLADTEENASMAEATLNNTVSKLQNKLKNTYVELAQLTRMLSCNEINVSNAHSDIQWLGEVADLLRGYPVWWHFLPRKWRERKISQLLLTRDLFDEEAYLDLYEDVRIAGMAPLRHYLKHGMAENRSRSNSSKRF